jgi:hypothetical protein
VPALRRDPGPASHPRIRNRRISVDSRTGLTQVNSAKFYNGIAPENSPSVLPFKSIRYTKYLQHLDTQYLTN